MDKRLLLPGHIYLVQAGLTDFFKIGYAVNVKARLKRVQTGCPYPLFLIKTVPGSPQLEADIHKMFGSFRRQGEWFQFNTLTTIWHTMDVVSWEALNA